MKNLIIDSTDLKNISPIFKGERRNWLRKLAMRVFGMDKVNDLYGRSCEYKGADFASHILEDLGVEYLIGYADRLKELPKGAFITISNHPYGGLDGVMLIDMMAHLRPDFKVMVNQFLSHIEAMAENFISVQPKIGRKTPDPISALNSIRETLSRLDDGHPVGFFPAGAVSMFHFKKLSISDRQWQEGVIKLIQKANVPVIPIRFFDRNSNFFYFLEIINWRVRTIRMSYELFNKHKKPLRIGIGEIISAEKIQSIVDHKELTKLLRSSVYDIVKPEVWHHRNDYKSDLHYSAPNFLSKSSLQTL